MSAATSFPKLTLNQRLGVVAFVLGLGALLAVPQPGGHVTLDTRELALIVEGTVDHVSAEELADWIIQGRGDYRLIDVRNDAGPTGYRIPTAEPVPLDSLLDYPLGHAEKIVLYSDEGIHGAQAWFLLKAHGYKAVYTLWGGLESWKDEVLFPALPESATAAQQADFERRKVVAQHFGGQPRTGVAVDDDVAAVALPTLDSAPAPAVAAPPKKRAKKGC